MNINSATPFEKKTGDIGFQMDTFGLQHNILAKENKQTVSAVILF
ncbi:hypothetical protein [Chryseobacterium polytrichastri]|nr:hypothetical protein [Chryseobacterium polytrichastri]